MKVKLWGMLGTINWVRELGYKHVIFEADAKIIVNSILADRMDGSEFRNLVLACWSLLQAEDFFLFQVCQEIS